MVSLLYIDLFCGAGGTSTGVELARDENGQKIAKVIACVNHDANAIASHAANHTDALHFTEDIRTLELSPLIEHVNRMKQLYPEAHLVLWASLECTNFSKAKGGQSRDADSRTLAEHLFRYIEAIDPDLIQIENVEEFKDWGPLIVKTVKGKDGIEYCPCNVEKKNKTVKYKDYMWKLTPQMIPEPKTKGLYYNRWVKAVKKYGYKFDHRILNAADFGAFTSRKRFFGQFAKKGIPIVWPEPTHCKEGSSTLFGKLQKWKPVKEVLDLEDEGTSIFMRKKPLSPKTFERVYAGLIRFVGGGKQAFLSRYNTVRPQDTCKSLDEPCGVLTTNNRFAKIGCRFLSKYYSGHPDSKNIPITGPAHTIKCIDNHSLVSAQFLAAYYGNGDNVSKIDSSCPTIPTKDRFNYVSPKFLCSYNFNDAGKDIQSPCPTLLTKDRLSLVSPFFMNYYSGGGQHSDINHPAPTILANPKQRLVSCQFMDQQFGQSKPTGTDRPLGEITANPKYNLVNCRPWVMNTNFGNVGSGINEPAPVITANRKWHYLMNPQFTSAGGSVDDPCFTLIARMDKRPPHVVTPKSMLGLDSIPDFVKMDEVGNIIIEIYEDDIPILKKIKEFMAMYQIVDILMRMLKIPELKRIMGFPENYVLVGSQADQKKFIGNAVEVNMARALCAALGNRLLELKQVA